MKNQKIRIAIALITGVVLIFSGIAKLLDIDSFIAQVQIEYRLGILAIFAPALIMVELFIGLRLLLLIKIKETAILTFLFLAVLTLFYTYGILWGTAQNCGCFGGFLEKYSNPATTYIRNAILMGFMWILTKSSIRVKCKFQQILFNTAIIMAVFATGFVTSPGKIMNLAKQSLTKNTTKTEAVINKNAISLTEKFNLKHETSYLLFFYSDNCPFCLNSIENVKLFGEKSFVDSVIFVHVGKGNNKNIDFLKTFHQTNTIVRHETMQPSDFHSISNIYPTALIIKNNKQFLEHKGMIPSPLTIEKTNKNLFRLLANDTTN